MPDKSGYYSTEEKLAFVAPPCEKCRRPMVQKWHEVRDPQWPKVESKWVPELAECPNAKDADHLL